MEKENTKFKKAINLSVISDDEEFSEDEDFTS